MEELVELALGHTVVRDRFTDTAPLTVEQAQELGALGYVARQRTGHRRPPRSPQLPAPPRVLETGGDVLARFQIRAREFHTSVHHIEALTNLIPASGLDDAPDRIATRDHEHSGVGIAEGWRGTIVHRVELAPDGTLDRVKIADPPSSTGPPSRSP